MMLLLLLTTACSRPEAPSGSHATPPANGPWPPQLVLTPGPGSSLQLSDASGAETGPRLDHLVWLGPDRVQVKWGTAQQVAYYQIDLKAGSLTPVPPEEAVLAISPDGRYGLVQPPLDRANPAGAPPGAVIDLQSGARLTELTERAESAQWLNDHLLYLDGGAGPSVDLLYDAATGRRIPLPKYVWDVGLLDGSTVCYGGAEQVGCTKIESGEAVRLTPERIHSQVPLHHMQPAIHAATGQVAYLYPRAAFLSSKAAGDTREKGGSVIWADTLGIHRAGKSVEHRLPGSFLPVDLTWSPDGADLWLTMIPVRRLLRFESAGEQSALYRFRAETGKLEDLLPQVYQLLRVEPDGSLIYTVDARSEPLIKRPGAEPEPWQPGKEFLPFPRSFFSHLAFLTGGTLEVQMTDGRVLSWPWSGSEKPGLRSISPDGTWAAVGVGSPFKQLLLLRR